ncbi:MAG: aminotransferase class V-fold PLP-dependent enzyme [Gemmatimonadales bacterium]|jgi:selenocysteine lyase/cysteine desulfurase|nr:aminotransferase class V-fold PLP-dependent enzyme [Gemmatimonadales bacterium]MBT3499207.1 aminotransferase class V-fold PLP-dependent enzyme [Gemmatimonadales bacterium]MBT3773810.1 aminotransferase class V-fold PLP-dependent enzyme [Gemmatimonadales bacterium]MBT3959760.1 aminotransferase class V-fold PLP-dependent enzyme [Gemmatimonadales bacterium]MBT4185797.1 aminotransferase class V-fold PLP-dependent enzyme [Gemmatimonadales bacterium]
MTPPLECQRHAFGLPREEHYLNCAYMGPLPTASEQAGVDALAKKRVPTRIVPPGDFWATDELRRLFAKLVNVKDPQRIAIQPGVSYGVACAAKNISVAPGQNIVMTHEQFPGNVYSWRRLASESGAELRVATPPEGPGRGAGWNESLLASIDSATVVVAVPHVHWTDGTRFDLEEVGRRCREVGAVLVVDGTQSLGAMPFDVEEVQPDVLICAAYKWLLGPYSFALSYFGERFDDGIPLEETWIARDKSDDFQHLVDYQDAYQPGAIRYDMAERSNFFQAPIAATSIELLLEWRPERIQDYCAELTSGLLAEAEDLGFSVEDAAYRGSHLFGLRMPEGLDLAALKSALAERNISASLRGTALRLSPNVYNDEADIEALMSVLRASVA